MISSTSRGEIFSPPPVDNLLESVSQTQIPIFVQHSLVTGAEPAIHIGHSIRFRVALITRRYIRTADYYFTDTAGR